MIYSLVTLNSSYFSRLTPWLGLFCKSRCFLILYLLSYKRLWNSWGKFYLICQLSPLLSRKRGNFKICVKSLIRTKIWMMKAIVWKNWIHLYNSHTSTTNFQTDVDCKYNNSLADKTICVVINKEWPLVKGKDDKLYH